MELRVIVESHLSALSSKCKSRRIRLFLVCDGTGSMGTPLRVFSNAMGEFLAVAGVIGLEIRV